MKNYVKHRHTAIAVILLVLLSLLLSGCGVSTDAGKETVGDFCAALKNDDLEAAVSLIHPSSELTAEQLGEAISDIEQRYGVDFSDGVVFKRCINVSQQSNVSVGNGTTKSLSLRYEVSISDCDLILSVVIIENNQGYGINTFLIESSAAAV